VVKRRRRREARRIRAEEDTWEKERFRSRPRRRVSIPSLLLQRGSPRSTGWKRLLLSRPSLIEEDRRRSRSLRTRTRTRRNLDLAFDLRREGISSDPLELPHPRPPGDPPSPPPPSISPCLPPLPLQPAPSSLPTPSIKLPLPPQPSPTLVPSLDPSLQSLNLSFKLLRSAMPLESDPEEEHDLDLCTSRSIVRFRPLPSRLPLRDSSSLTLSLPSRVLPPLFKPKKLLPLATVSSLEDQPISSPESKEDSTEVFSLGNDAATVPPPSSESGRGRVGETSPTRSRP